MLRSTDIDEKNVAEHRQTSCRWHTDSHQLTDNAKGSVVAPVTRNGTVVPQVSDYKARITEKIQYTVDNTNMEVVRARNHFRARLCSPLVLFHHEIPWDKECIGQIERRMTYTMT
jgi:hypothetical protein